MLLVVILNALLASTFAIGKVALNYTTPGLFVGLSMVIGGLFLLTGQYMHSRKPLVIPRQDIHLFAQVAVLSIYLSYFLQFWGLAYLPSFKACFLYSSGPFTSYLIAYFLFKEKMVIKKWIGLFLGFLGLIPVLISTSPAEQGFASLIFFGAPEIAVILSAAAYSYGWFIIKRLVHEKHYSVLTVNGIAMFFGGLLSLLTVIPVDGAFIIKSFPPFAITLILTILIEYLICNNLYAMLLKKHSETFLSLSTFLIPLFGALYGWLFLSEMITWHFFLSCLMVGGALIVFYKAER